MKRNFLNEVQSVVSNRIRTADVRGDVGDRYAYVLGEMESLMSWMMDASPEATAVWDRWVEKQQLKEKFLNAVDNAVNND